MARAKCACQPYDTFFLNSDNCPIHDDSPRGATVTQIQVIVRTGHKTNQAQGGSENKFYRTYELPNGSMFQWGSARGGMSGGQFGSTMSKSDAAIKMTTKNRDGYDEVHQPISFTVDEARLIQQGGIANKAGQRFLENQYHAAVNSSVASSQITNAGVAAAGAAPAAPAARVLDRLGSLSSEILETITLAASSPNKAMVARVALLDRLEEVQADVRKALSYMETLDVMLDDVL